ncbi:Zinc ion binding protein [Phytophthora palmivora]|uniref:Zinc ion binding protein n=1 Tax=Phytophthora palmivora TaxID=4796 RepID=A0A2P4XUH6_9STRA|nr:Zinc ion binding protein [Phytophthora palmivora]
MIRSIRDLVGPDDVEITLPHEHVLHNIGTIIASTGSSADLEIRFEDLIDYRRAPYARGGRNLLLHKEDEAFRELEKLEQLGTNKLKSLVVDVTLPSEGRDAFVRERLQLSERLTDLKLLTVTTFEVERLDEGFCNGLSMKEQSERIAKTLEAELMFGIASGKSVAFPGAMYQQIHSSGGLSPKEQILAQGLGLAQTRTKAPLYLSFSLEKTTHDEILELEQVTRAWVRALLDAGADSKKLVVCHADRWCRGRFETGYEFLLELFGMGVSVLFDMVGLVAVSEPQYLPQILLSTNVHQRIQYRRYGGGGYTYLFDHFKHRLLRQGVTATEWDQIVRANVVNLLAWYVPPEAPPIPKNYLQCSICSNFFEPIEGEYFTKFTFTYCGTKCLRRHSRQQFAPLPAKS